MFHRIITHDDFDGLISAAICAHALKIDQFAFAGPRTITDSRIPTRDTDIVCDLPYPLECGMWFDHHPGNLEDLDYRQITLDDIEGRFEAKPSCARVCFEYFSEKEALPGHFGPMTDEADILDSFDFKDIEDWRRETPGKIVDAAIKLRTGDMQQKRKFLARLVRALKTSSLEEVARLPEVQEKHALFKEEEERMLHLIRQDASFLEEDKNKELVVVDLTRHNRPPNVMKNLAFLLYPEAKAVMDVKNRFIRGQKTNDFNVSVSLSVNMNQEAHSKDIGEIMRQLNIGDGHPGAGAGAVNCQSKPEMLKEKEALTRQIFKMWSDQ